MRDALERQQDKHKAMWVLARCHRAIGYAASDLSAVGLDKMADRLLQIWKDMEESMNDLDRIDGEDITEAMRLVEESSYNVLQSTLAGLELAKKSQENSQN